MSIRWNGGSPENALNKAAFALVRDGVSKRLRQVRCPEHGSVPTHVSVSGHDLNSLTWEVRGCCDKLRSAAAAALR